jgi:Flp pilus assembly protein TadG
MQVRPLNRHTRRGQRGSSIVEFAIVSSVVLLLIMSILDCGRALFTYHLLANNARQATRFAVVRGSTCTATGCPAQATDLTAYVKGISTGIDPNGLTVLTSWSSVPANGCTAAPYQGPGCLVTVEVDYTFRFVSPLMPNISMPMKGVSQMYIAQ